MADRFNESLARDYDNVSQLAAMDKEGLDVAVLFRTSPLHANENFEPEYANDLCKAWNDWMADFCKADSKRLKGSALITLHDVDLAVKEAKRAVKNGAVGLSLCPEPINGRQIHDRYFDPLWQEAQEMNIPICFHPPARPQQPQVSQDRFEGHPNQALLGESAAQSDRANSRRERVYRRRRVGEIPEAQSRFSRRQLRLAAVAALSHRRILGDAGQDGRYSAAPETERIFQTAMFYLRRRRRGAGEKRHRLYGRRQYRDLDRLSAHRLPLAARAGGVSCRCRFRSSRSEKFSGIIARALQCDINQSIGEALAVFNDVRNPGHSRYRLLAEV